MRARNLASAIARAACAAILGVPSAASAQAPAAALQVASPDGRNVAVVEVRDGGLFYRVDRAGRHVMLASRLGFAFRGAPALRDSLAIAGSERSSYDTTWTQPWGDAFFIRKYL